MRRALAALAAALLAAAPAAASAQAVRSLSPGDRVDWSFETSPSPAHYRVGPLAVTLRGERDPEMPDLVAPVMIVAVPGQPSVRVEGVATSPAYESRLAVGRWDADRPYLLFQTYSGGAHCCTQFQLVYPDGGAPRLVDLGEWDGGPMEEAPADLDGDGRLDFVFYDNAFLYAFASYAESFAPPLVFNIVDGSPVDVSANAGFRPLFERAMARSRPACLGLETNYEGMGQNGACAAYVASAARVGQFDRAWAEMLRSYDRDSSWQLPTACRAEPVDHQCPEDQVIAFDSYPDALRSFLVELGYIGRERREG